MRTFASSLIEIQLHPQGMAGRFTCPLNVRPLPGQYFQAWLLDEPENPLPFSLFPSIIEAENFLAAPPLPVHWQVGARLNLRGPLGQGFHLPSHARHIALAACGESALRLLPLMAQALDQDCAVALFAGCPLPAIPSAVEIFPLAALPENLAWPEYLALDLPGLAGLEQLKTLLPAPLPCPAQALVVLPMPCGGLADCAICAVPARHGHWKLACAEGPVFDLKEILIHA